MSRVYIENGKLKYKEVDLRLEGSGIGSNWDIDNTNPDGDPQWVVELTRREAESGSNFAFMNVNLRLYAPPPKGGEDYHDQYMVNIQKWVDGFVDNDMFFVIKLQDCKYRSDYWFSSAGDNYKIAESSYWRQKCIEFFLECAEKWRNLPNFIGISPLNEPFNGETLEHWDTVNQFYLDAIDAVRVIDPSCIFFCSAPYRWSGEESLLYYKTGGYLPRSGVAYEYHQYCDSQHWGRPWCQEYINGDVEQGRLELNQALDNYIVPILNDGYPVLNGEFGTRSDDNGYPSTPNWDKMYVDQIEGMRARGIHYSIWRTYRRLNSSHRWAIHWKDLSYNDSGLLWASQLADNLVRPSMSNGGEILSLEYENKDSDQAITLQIGRDETIVTFVPRETYTLQPGERVTITTQEGERVVFPEQ